MQSDRMSEHLVRFQRLMNHARLQGWSDAELSRQIGRSQQQVNSWRDGSRRIGERLARSLEEKLGMPRFELDDRPTTPLALGVSEPTPRWGDVLGTSLADTRPAQSMPVYSWTRLGEMLAMTHADRQALPQLETFVPTSDRAFFLTMEDDSMAPRIQQGDDLLFDPLEAPRAGDLVLVRVAAGEMFVRSFRPKTAQHWEALPINSEYLPLTSVADGIEVIAVAVEHRSYLRRR